MKIVNRRSLHWTGVSLIVFGSVSIVLYWNQRNIATKPYTFDPSATIESSTDEPSESDISNDAGLIYPADQPKKIILNSIAVSGYIQKVGTDNARNMATPKSIYIAGWYTNSVKPGDAGLSIINGHVSGKYRPGIFKELEKIQPGQTFTIQYGDNSMRTFQVKQLNKVPLESVDSILYAQQPDIKQQLNLITCTGRFDGSNNTYSERLIAISERID